MKGNENGRKTFLARAETYIARSLHQMALNLAEDRLNRFHDDIDARLVISRVMIQTGNYEKAREMMEEAEDIIYWSSRIYVCLGDICRKKGRIGEAAALYKKFLHLNPRSPMTEGVSEKLSILLQTA